MNLIFTETVDNPEVGKTIFVAIFIWFLVIILMLILIATRQELIYKSKCLYIIYWILIIILFTAPIKWLVEVPKDKLVYYYKLENDMLANEIQEFYNEYEVIEVIDDNVFKVELK